MSAYACNVHLYVSRDDQSVYFVEPGRSHHLLYAVEDSRPVFRRSMRFLRRYPCRIKSLEITFPPGLSVKRRTAALRGLLWLLRQMQAGRKKR